MQECKDCGAGFDGHKRKYCNARCRTKSRDAKRGPFRKAKSCEKCGESFIAHHSTTQFCPARATSSWVLVQE